MEPPFSRGDRIRLLRDNGRTQIIGFEGTVDQVTQLGAIVILDNDPFDTFHAASDRYGPINRVTRRFFQFNEIERIEGN